MIVVLETEGKNDSVDYVKVKLFHIREVAEKYCEENTDDPADNNKYWKFCEIIDEDQKYEVCRYENIP